MPGTGTPVRMRRSPRQSMHPSEPGKCGGLLRRGAAGTDQPAANGKAVPDLQGQTNIRADDPNKELKAEKERLQLQKDVKQLRKDVYSGQSFVKTVMTNASQQFLTKAASGAMSYAAKQFITKELKNPDRRTPL